MPSQRSKPRSRCRLPSTAPPRDRACPRPTVPCPVTELRTDRPRTLVGCPPAVDAPASSRRFHPDSAHICSSPAPGEVGASMLHPAQPKGGFASEMQARLVLSGQAWQLMSAMCCPRDRRHGNVCLRCALGSSAMARCSRNEFRAPGRGDMSTLRIPERLAVAEYRRDAFPGGHPWQVFRFMHPRRGLGREKRPSLARHRRHVSKMNWHWQDMRAMYPKSASNRLSGMHSAQILPRFSARKVLRAEGWRRWVVASALCIEADGPHVRTRPSPTAPMFAHARGRRPRIP